MGTNKHPSTNIYKDLFVAHSMYKYIYPSFNENLTSKQVIKSWSIKRDISQHDKHKDNHYVNPHVIRTMIYIIAKQRWEHKNNGPYKTWVSQMLYMHVNGLINMALAQWTIKHDML